MTITATQLKQEIDLLEHTVQEDVGE